MSTRTEEQTRRIDESDEAARTVDLRDPEAASERDTPEIAQTIGRYVITESLGAGAMGVVVRAYDPKLHREVALKLVRSGGRMRSEEARARLLREAQSLAQLSHRNVVAVYDAEATDQGVCLAMEYIEGSTLRGWLQEAQRDWREIVDVGRGIALGLAAAHAAGLVHRDVKPDNVMIAARGPGRAELIDRVRVTDFGLARLRAGASTGSQSLVGDDREVASGSGSGSGSIDSMDLTRTGTAMGTPAYMSPEQHHGAAPDAKADQYALCVVLWEALYGERPFTGKTYAALTAAKQEGPPERPRSSVPAWVHRIVARGLAVRPADRHRSCEALADALATGRAKVQRRRIALGVAFVGLLGIGGLIGNRIEQGRRAAACEEAGQALAEVWNEDVAQRLRASLTASGPGYAGETFDKAVPWIDAWTREWSGVRESTCKAATVDHTFDPELYARSEACLRERSAELAGYLQGLADADAAKISELVPTVAGLPRVEECGDEVALRRRPPLPDDPAQRERLAALRLELQRVRGSGLAGRNDEALAEAEALAERAREEDYGPLRAEAALVVADLAGAADRPPQTEAALREAFSEALVVGDDAVAASAAANLTFHVGYREVRFDEGLVWAQTAEALARRLGEIDGLLGATVLGNRAVLYYHRGDFELAAADHERTIAIRERILGPEHPLLAVSLLNLGNLYSRVGKAELARATLQRALDIQEATLGPDHPDVAFSLTNLGNAYLDAGDPKTAEAMLTRAMQIRIDALGPDHPTIAHSLVNIALVYMDAHEFERARANDEKALAILDKALGPDHPDLAIVLGNLGNVLNELGRYEEARACHTRVLEIRRAHLRPNDRRIAESLSNRGFVWLHEGKPADSYESFAEALQIFEQALPPDDPELADALLRVATAERARGEYEAALSHQRRALEIRTKADGADAPSLAAPLVEIGETLLAAGRVDEAHEPTARAEALGERIDDEATRVGLEFLLARLRWELPVDAGADRAAARATIDKVAADTETADTETRQAARGWLATHPADEAAATAAAATGSR